MWYKIEEIEAKYGLTKFSIYALITQEPELRKHIKALEGVLQINEEGIGVLLKHASKKTDDSPPTYADNNTIIFARDKKEEQIPAPVHEEEDEGDDLFGSVFQSTGSFFDEKEEPLPAKDAEHEEFFTSMGVRADMAAAAAASEPEAAPEPAIPEGAEEFTAEDLVFQEAPEALDDMGEADEVNPAVFDDVAAEDDFFSDYAQEEEDYLAEPETVTEFEAASGDDFTMEGYIKALKEKMIIQNEQIRSLSVYLDVSRKMLLQDEKIVGILEGMYRK